MSFRQSAGGIVCLLSALILLCGTQCALGQTSLTKGDQLLLEQGLQIQAQVFASTNSFDRNRWAQSNFTTVNWQWRDGPPFGPAPGLPWGRWLDYTQYGLPAQELPYASNLVSLQCSDEPTLSDTATRQELSNWFDNTRAAFPNALLFTNLQGNSDAPSDIAAYMSESKPDMLMYDSYPINRYNTIVGGSMKYLYDDMAKFRTLGLAGNDGTGAHPIPVGHYMQNFHDDNTWPRFPSESETRLSQFAGWTFGEKFESSFVYDDPNYQTLQPQFFTGLGDSNPTPAFSQMAESNRQSRNLGPALVRLISTDVRFFPGQHKDASNATVSNDVPTGMQTWQAGAGDPYLQSVTAVNLGTTNSGLRGDVLVGWFKVLDESMDGPDAQNQIYFMVLNGLTDANGSAADCQQRITLKWKFGTSGITQVQRLDRNTGQIDELALTPLFGGQMVLTFTLDGGTADLFKFDTGAPFVGIDAVPEPGTLGLAGLLIVLAAGRRRKAHHRMSGCCCAGDDNALLLVAGRGDRRIDRVGDIAGKGTDSARSGQGASHPSRARAADSGDGDPLSGCVRSEPVEAVEFHDGSVAVERKPSRIDGGGTGVAVGRMGEVRLLAAHCR